MRKFFVLFLVLAATSLANATLTFDISDLSDISIIGDGITASQPVYIMFTGDLVMDASSALSLPGTIYEDFVLNALTFGQAISGDAELFADLMGSGGLMVDAAVMISGMAYVSGSGDMQVMSEGSYYDAQTADIASVTIPEPMTIILLGLGGFLVRRKK